MAGYLKGVVGLPDGMVTLNGYFKKFGLTAEGRRLVLETFRAPARRVGGGPV